MEAIIKTVFDSIGVGGLTGLTGLIVGLFGWAFYRTLLNVFLTPENIDKIGDSVKKLNARIKDPRARALTELKEARVCVDVLRDIGYSSLLRADTDNTLSQRKLRLSN